MSRITATDASRRFARLLDEVEHNGVSFVIERHGRSVAQITPPAAGHTVGELRAALRAGVPDPEWARDMESVVAARRSPPRDPWNTD